MKVDPKSLGTPAYCNGFTCQLYNYMNLHKIERKSKQKSLGFPKSKQKSLGFPKRFDRKMRIKGKRRMERKLPRPLHHHWRWSFQLSNPCCRRRDPPHIGCMLCIPLKAKYLENPPSEKPEFSSNNRVYPMVLRVHKCISTITLIWIMVKAPHIEVNAKKDVVLWSLLAGCLKTLKQYVRETRDETVAAGKKPNSRFQPVRDCWPETFTCD